VTNLIGDMARSFGLPRLKRAAGVVTRRLPIPQPVLMVGPGASALTVMLRPRISLDRIAVMVSIADLVAA